MKKVIYKSVYKLLSALSGKVNNRYINRYKIAVGTSLLLLTSACQGQNKDNKSVDNQPSSGIIEADCYIAAPEFPIKKDTIQNETDSIEEDIFCYAIEIMPELPGGAKAMAEFLEKNTYYPKEHIEKGIQGRVIIQFVVEKDGSISNPEVIRSLDEKLDRIALEAINKMPKFKPGYINGEPIRMKYTVPVPFIISRKNQ